MLIKLEVVKENEDGSADCTLEVDVEAKTHLINLGLMEVLKKAIDEGKKYTPDSLFDDYEEVVVKVDDEEDNEEELHEFADNFEDGDYNLIGKPLSAVTFTDETMDKILVKSLQEAYDNTFCKFWHEEDIKFNKELRKSLRFVLSYYMTSQDYKKFFDMMDKKNRDEE